MTSRIRIGPLTSLPILFAFGTLAACSSAMVSQVDAATATDGAAGPMRPPGDPSALGAWLEEGDWRTWRCQAESHPATGGSPHGTNRICQNDIVTAALGGSGDWPVGATLVKENFDGAGSLVALFIATRTSSAPGREGWYFLRRDVVAHTDFANPAFCADCHSASTRDFVLSTVP